MLFNSLHFFLFFPLFLLVYYLLPFRQRWIAIFIGSCYFYMAFVPYYILILFFIILVDYIAARTIERVHGRLKLFFLILSLAANLLLLCFFKYFNFLNENIESISKLFGHSFKFSSLDIVLPIGLSFHTFQSMSYTVEVYRGKQKAERHLGYFANYVLFFPQMVAGPIERYASLGNELRTERPARYENFIAGLRLILFGLFVKTVVADNLAPFVNAIYKAPLQYGSLEVLLAVFAFSFQIYADFYGYSTIAKGAARMMGIEIMDNFKTPYLARNISEFWQRWHISLSTWFRDYLYIPLGGNKVKFGRWIYNIMLVFLLSGLWHGASWTFVIWGACHGLMYLAERLANAVIPFKKMESSALLNGLLIVKNFVIVSFIWIFFRAENMQNVKDVFNALWNGWSVTEIKAANASILVFILLLVCSDIFFYNKRCDLWLKTQNSFTRWAFYSILLYGILALSGVEQFAFIYFQF